MGRVDEAMRRAAADGNGGVANDVLDDTLHGSDIEDLAREPFPIEMPERKPVRAAAPIATVVPGPNGKSPAPVPPAPAVRPVADAHEVADHIDQRLNEKVVVDDHTLPASREQYRRLAAILHDAQLANGFKVVMIASAVAGEGKTLTAANLALTLSESYRKRVLLIDADLRKPTMHTIFKIESATGLGDGLSSSEDATIPVRQISPQLSVLPAGRPSSDPMGGLTSVRMRRLIEEAKETFDWIIIDTPPLVLLPDANLLGSMVDGTVLVIRADSTPHELIRRAVESVGRDRILGAVLNQAATTPLDGYGYGYGYYYTSHTSSAATADSRT